MRITELLMTELSLDWLWERLPRRPVWFDGFVDKAHFALIINCACDPRGGVLHLTGDDRLARSHSRSKPQDHLHWDHRSEPPRVDSGLRDLEMEGIERQA